MKSRVKVLIDFKVGNYIEIGIRIICRNKFKVSKLAFKGSIWVLLKGLLEYYIYICVLTKSSISNKL